MVFLPISIGSPHDDGRLTFKFDPVANDWDEKLYSELVQVLSVALISKARKSTLECVLYLYGYSLIQWERFSRHGANAVWEAATLAAQNRAKNGELQFLPLDIQRRKAPDSVTKPRPRPKS
jgi:hypothetical protein